MVSPDNRYWTQPYGLTTITLWGSFLTSSSWGPCASDFSPQRIQDEIPPGKWQRVILEFVAVFSDRQPLIQLIPALSAKARRLRAPLKQSDALSSKLSSDPLTFLAPTHLRPLPSGFSRPPDEYGVSQLGSPMADANLGKSINPARCMPKCRNPCHKG